MSAFSQSALQLQQTQAPDWLAPIQQRGRERWKVTPFPTRKTENWKYTSLQALESGSYLRWPSVTETDAEAAVPAIVGLDAFTVVFINGVFSPAHSSVDWPAGVECVHFAEASESQREAILDKLGQIVDSEKHLFAALNESWLRDGVYLHVAANTAVEQPLHIHHFTTAQAESFSVNQRLLVHLESGAEATVVEHFSSSDEEQNSFTNGVTELQVDANAKLAHYRLNLEEEHALHIGGVHANLERDATLDSFMIAAGSTLQRVDVVVNHNGPGAHCGLDGIYLPCHKHLVDYHTCIEHRAPHCTTNEVFRGIIGDSGRAVFNGRIHIHPHAQKTVAELSNKNLLTSHDAEVDTKPELEIYADDVQCSHGATVAQLEEKKLYYLLSRGVDRDQAEIMLSFGFINELLEQIPHAAVHDFVTPVVADLFRKNFQRLRERA